MLRSFSSLTVLSAALSIFQASSSFAQDGNWSGSGGGSSSGGGTFTSVILIPPPLVPVGQSFLRTTQITDLMCGYTANTGSGAQCGEPTFTWLSASSNSCTPIQAQDSRCPVADYFRGRSKDCGVESYNTGTGFECGSDSHEFWSDWGGSCPGTTILNGAIGVVSIGSIDTEVRVHRSGWKVSTQTRHKCRGKAPRSCRHEKFGVELFKECNLGVKSYQVCTVAFESCRHPNHGEESRVYPTCQNEVFGTTPKSCVIPDIKAQKDEIERFSSELNSYLLAIEGVKAVSTPVIATLTSAKTMLESTLAYLTSSEAAITAELSVTPSDSLRDRLSETQSSIVSVNETIQKIQACETNNAVCDISGSNVVILLQTQVTRIRSSLSVIRDFLIKEDARLAGTADALRAQIKELLESPHMKNPS